MDPRPIGKRTRYQRALREKEVKETNKRARIAARNKNKMMIDVHVEEVIEEQDKEQDKEREQGEEVKVVDRAEYLRRISCVGCNVDSPNDERFEDPMSWGGYYNYYEHNHDWNEEVNMNWDVNGEDSDDSVHIIGEKWNPLMIDHDDEEDEEVGIDGGKQGGACKGDGCQPSAARDKSASVASGGVSDDSTSSDDDDDTISDKDFRMEEVGVCTASDYSSSDVSEKDNESEGLSSDNEEDVVVVRAANRHHGRSRIGRVNVVEDAEVVHVDISHDHHEDNCNGWDSSEEDDEVQVDASDNHCHDGYIPMVHIDEDDVPVHVTVGDDDHYDYGGNCWNHFEVNDGMVHVVPGDDSMDYIEEDEEAIHVHDGDYHNVAGNRRRGIDDEAVDANAGVNMREIDNEVVDVNDGDFCQDADVNMRDIDNEVIDDDADDYYQDAGVNTRDIDNEVVDAHGGDYDQDVGLNLMDIDNEVADVDAGECFHEAGGNRKSNDDELVDVIVGEYQGDGGNIEKDNDDVIIISAGVYHHDGGDNDGDNEEVGSVPSDDCHHDVGCNERGTDDMRLNFKKREAIHEEARVNSGDYHQDIGCNISDSNDSRLKFTKKKENKEELCVNSGDHHQKVGGNGRDNYDIRQFKKRVENEKEIRENSVEVHHDVGCNASDSNDARLEFKKTKENEEEVCVNSGDDHQKVGWNGRDNDDTRLKFKKIMENEKEEEVRAYSGAAHHDVGCNGRDSANVRLKFKKIKEKISNGEVQRKLYDGLVLPVNPENTGRKVKSVANRTRSNWKPRPLVKKTGHGTLRCPVTVDDEDRTSLHDKQPEKIDNQETGEMSKRVGPPTTHAQLLTQPRKMSMHEFETVDRPESSQMNKREALPRTLDPLSHTRPLKNRLKKSERQSGEVIYTVTPTKNTEEVRETELQRHKNGSEKLDEVEKQGNGEMNNTEMPPKVSDVALQPRPQRNGVKKMKEKVNDVQNTLLSILENEQQRSKDISTKEMVYLPLKFTFPPPAETVVTEQTEEEKETADLFNQLDLALQDSYIGSNGPSHDNKDVTQSAKLNSQEKLCANGNHHFIDDEEIGIVCKFCSLVQLESKYVTADFSNDPFGGRNRKDSARLPGDGNKDSDGIEIPDSRDGCQEDPSTLNDVQGSVWELIPGTRRTLFPHQREGFEFIWKNVAGGIKIDELKEPTGHSLGGCIICHAPGTGKTRLALVFLQSYMKLYPRSRPVIIAPRSMLRTWEEEFTRWKVSVPFLNMNDDELSGKEDPEALKHVHYAKSIKTIRLAKIYTWSKGKGVIGISYGLFKKLAGEDKGTNEKIRQALLKDPDILVLDEGHTPRNDKSFIWKVLCNVSTKKRVILSGTPFQNNFDELSNTISLVREEFGVFALPGNDVHDGRRIEELRNNIRPFVHVHKGEILRETLRGLFHSLIYLKPSNLQKKCFARLGSHKNNFALDNLVSTISVHPSIFCDQKAKFFKLWQPLFEQHKEDLDAGVKTRFLVELIRLSQGERVLVFGQFLPPLNYIAGLLKSCFGWTMGRELLYMDGKQDAKERQTAIRVFNDPTTEARVLLASTKACCEGIHLVGASRVVLLDVVWNPSVERQAISRAYRLGQKKDVYVYHLITSGSLEEQKYRQQAKKDRLSEQVFVEENSMHKEGNGSRVLVDQVLAAMKNHEKLAPMFEKIVYQPKYDNLIESFGPLNL